MNLNKNIMSLAQSKYHSSAKMGEPLISQGRELRSRRVIVQSLPPVLAGARMGQYEEDFYFDEYDQYDPDTAPPYPGYVPEYENEKEEEEEYEIDSQFYQNLGGSLAAGIGALSNLLVGAASGASVPPQGAKISAVQPQKVATVIRSKPEVLPVSGEAAYQLLAISRQRQLTPEESAMLQQLIYSRSQLPAQMKYRFDSAGKRIIMDQGGSDRLLQKIGNFFTGADKELTKKRAFTLENLFTNPYFLTAAGTFLFLWMLRR